jgi:hypothetical protein
MHQQGQTEEKNKKKFPEQSASNGKSAEESKQAV